MLWWGLCRRGLREWQHRGRGMVQRRHLSGFNLQFRKFSIEVFPWKCGSRRMQYGVRYLGIRIS
jgi:hypothetical protein